MPDLSVNSQQSGVLESGVRLDTSIISDLDIKSLESNSPIHDTPEMGNFDSLLSPNNGSDENMSSIEVIDDSEVNQMDKPDNREENSSDS